MNLSLLGMIAPCLFALAPAGESYLCQPAYSLDDVVRLPMQSYVPQPGDIFMATDQRIWYRIGHTIAGAHGVHHSGIVIAKPDGSLGLIEAGPFDSLVVEIMDPYEHMSKHVAAGDSVWVRRRRVPLTPDQSARLTAFACAQEGKPFAVVRWLGTAHTPALSRAGQHLVPGRASGPPPAVVLLGAGHRVLRRRGPHGQGQSQTHGNLSLRPVLRPVLQPVSEPSSRRRAAGVVPAIAMASRLAHPAVTFGATLTLVFSPRTSIAAFRPLMPITLPPGCVHAPQRKTPGIGVRGDRRFSHM